MEQDVILIIDDQKEILEVFSELLTHLMPNVRVETSWDPIKGLDLARKISPSVIVLDVSMPGMDGLTLCKTLKGDEETRHIPIILLTAVRIDTRSRINGLDSGADAYLTKPIDSEELTAWISAMLRIRKSEDKLRRQNDRLEEDVTRRSAELKKSEELFRLFMDSTPSAAYIKDLEGKFIYTNLYFRGLFKIEDERYIGKSPEDFFTPETAAAMSKIENGVLEKGIPSTHRVKGFVPGTENIWELSLFPIFGSGSRPSCIGCTATDITERELSERAVREREKSFRKIIQSSSSIDVSIDQLGNILDLSESLGQFLGISSSELVGHNIGEYSTDSGKILGELINAAVIDGHAETKSIEFKVRSDCSTQNSEKTMLREAGIHMARFDHGDHEPATLVCFMEPKGRIVEDNTEKNFPALEETPLSIQGYLLDKAIENSRSLIAGLHLVRMISQPGSTTSQMIYQAMIKSSFLRDTIEKIGCMSGVFQQKTTECLAEEIVQKACLHLPRVRRLKCSSRDSGLISIKCDQTQVASAIRGILLGRLENCSDREEVFVAMESTGEYGGKALTITVVSGFAGVEGSLIHLDRFESAAPNSPEPPCAKSPETSISRLLIEKNGGRIVTGMVDNLPGCRIVLPISRETRLTDTGVASPEGVRRVLLMDDEEMVLNTTKRLLNYLGYDVETTKSGEEAIKAYRDGQSSGSPYSVVILDISVPDGMGARETIGTLKEIDPAVSVIISSGFMGDPLLSKPRDHGFNGALEKPYSLAKLREAMADVFGEPEKHAIHDSAK